MSLFSTIQQDVARLVKDAAKIMARPDAHSLFDAAAAEWEAMPPEDKRRLAALVAATVAANCITSRQLARALMLFREGAGSLGRLAEGLRDLQPPAAPARVLASDGAAGE